MKSYLYIIYSFILAFILISCDTEAQDTGESNLFECQLEVNGGLQQYTEAKTRAAISWQTGTRIYIQLASASVHGYAVYNESTGTWNAYLNGNPSETTTGKASVYFFDNGTYLSSYATLNSSTGIYSDRSASYTYSKAGGLVLSTNIKPLYGRIRFRGTYGQSINISGITYLTNYNYSGDYFNTSSTSISLSVGADGYTDYVYGEFTDASTRQLTLTTGGVTYTTYCSSNMYKAGQSGYLNIPSPSSHAGWKSDNEGNSNSSISVDDFSSEECWDQNISQTINLSLDDFSAEDDWSPKVSSAEVKLTNMIVLSDGFCFDYEFSGEAYTFMVNLFSSSSSYYNATDDAIAQYMEDYVTGKSVEEYKANNYYSSYVNQTSGTNYMLCSLALDKNGKRGVLNKYKFQTPSTSGQPIASLGTWSYQSNYWNISVTRNSYCSSYYYICYSGTNISDWDNIELAHNIKQWIDQGDTSHNITDTELNFSIGSTTPAIVGTWGVNSSGTLSGVVSSKGNSYYNSKYPSAKLRSKGIKTSDNFRSVSKDKVLEGVEIYFVSK